MKPSYPSSELNIKKSINNELNTSDEINNSPKPNKFKLILFITHYMVINVALPLALYFSLKPILGELYAAIISSIPDIISILWSLIVNRIIEFLPVIIILSFFISLTLSLIFNNAKLNELKGAIVLMLIGTGFSISYRFERPLLYYLNRPWQTQNDLDKFENFNNNWQQPGYRGVMNTLSLVWGFTFIGSAIVIIVLVFTIQMDLLIIFSNVFTFGTILILSLWTAIYSLHKKKLARLNRSQSNK
jgi:intracellular septation protein A